MIDCRRQPKVRSRHVPGAASRSETARAPTAARRDHDPGGPASLDRRMTSSAHMPRIPSIARRELR